MTKRLGSGARSAREAGRKTFFDAKEGIRRHRLFDFARRRNEAARRTISTTTWPQSVGAHDDLGSVMWSLYIGVFIAILASAACALMYARCAREERERVRQGLPPRWDGSLVGGISGPPRHVDPSSLSAWGGGPQYQQYAQTYPNAPAGQVVIGVPANGGGVNQQPVGVVVHQATVQPHR